MIKVYYGNERFLWKEAVNKQYKELQKEDPYAELLMFDSSDADFSMDLIEQACHTVALFSTKRCVALRFEHEKDQNKYDNPQFEGLLSSGMHDVVFLVALAKKPLVKSSLHAVLKQHVQTEELKNMDAKGFAAWALRILKEHGIHLEKEAQQLFLERIHENRQRCLQECEKLAVLDRLLTRDDIDGLVSAAFDEHIFDLGNAILSKKKDEAFKIYHSLLLQKSDPLGLMGLIAVNLRLNYQVAALRQANYAVKDVADMLAIKDTRVYAIAKYQNRPPQETLKLLHALAELDQNIKLGKRDKFVGFELFMLEAMH